MRDFPPTVTAYAPARRGPQVGIAAGQGPRRSDPDTRSAVAFLRWTLSWQPEVIASATVVGVLWQLPLTVGPWLFGKAVDRGILPGSTPDTLLWAGLLLVVTLVGAFFGIAMHTLVVRSWLIGIYGTTLLVTRKAVQMGHVLPRRTPTGEVLSVASSDSDEFGAFTEILARAGSQLIAYLGSACGPLFINYVGQEAVNAEVLDFGAFYPRDQDWTDGDRGVTCYVYRIDEKPVTSSLKKSN